MAISKGNNKGNENNWISFSDIMTGLMVIFMFIAISYIIEVQNKQKERDVIFEEFKATKEQLYSELENTFKDDFKEWQVELDKDLSIKFTNPEVLFESGQTNIRPYFSTILDDFLPRYFDILLQVKYTDKIAEIRIEGHTDTVPAYQYDRDSYIGNVILSQLRSAQVLKYFRDMEYYQNLNNKTEQKLQFWLTANGLSYGRTLDDNKELTVVSGKPANNKFSRRVEFRIITTSESLVDKVIKELSK
ncbi:outer membrane protein OmpA-like peptidoglycan-associated protein [Breznakibacter xylanolyticus]|uniref:Outer membrane protein OmpA-like peptidoglycan-associated protein n=1 Tax=Breznakibacter xylanolyticus TaxID=990 RepID=A0A2W7PZI8_9BACT|nr:OmpA family protein [Breznakibacter xylanolyticus]PZX14949.1 outer membrane protein OmpA-like peptidoglycan-associated protein [Breznakibacter xylanolyticus]